MTNSTEPATPDHGDVVAFYDGFAADYDLAYGGAWESAVERQGVALDQLIRRERPHATTVLDCACGIGTQSIGLALRGYRVLGTDVSPGALERAETEAAVFGVAFPTRVADFRDLSSLGDVFDVVICCDNALPHLLEPEHVVTALASMRHRLAPNGLLVVTMRDFDRALLERPPIGPPLVVPGLPRRVLVRLHDWHPEQPLYDVTYLILSEQESGGWKVADHKTRYRAITRAELVDAAARAGLERVVWTDDVIVGGQQVVIATRA